MSQTTSAATTLSDRLSAAKRASIELATATTERKNAALSAIAAGVLSSADEIIAANELDVANGRENGLSTGLLDRLTLTPARLQSLADAVLEVVGLTDPVGQAVRGSALPNGVRITQVRVPFGVVGAIYEARPNVTVDIAALAIKSGNAVVLRGGSAAINTNRVLVGAIQDALATAGLPADAAQTIDDFGREGAAELMRARGLVDVLIPRGSADLIRTVASYNSGPGTILKTVARLGEDADSLLVIESMPGAETREFVERVMANYWIYRKLWALPSPSLDAVAAGRSRVPAILDANRGEGAKLARAD